MSRIIYLRPHDEVEPGRWEALDELSDSDLRSNIERAELHGYSVESSIVDSPPYTHRIRLRGEGHLDFFATVED